MERGFVNKWLMVVVTGVLVIGLGFCGYFFGANYSIVSKNKLKKTDEIIVSLENEILDYQKQAEEIHPKMESLESKIQALEKEVKKKDEVITQVDSEVDSAVAENTETDSEDNIDNTQGDDEAIIENEEVTVDMGSGEAYVIPTWDEILEQDSEDDSEPYTMNVVSVTTADGDGYSLVMSVTITNNTSEAIEVKPYTLNLEVNNDDTPIINEHKTLNYEKYVNYDSMPIFGMKVQPYEARNGLIIYDVADSDTEPVHLSWDGPAGTAEFYF